MRRGALGAFVCLLVACGGGGGANAPDAGPDAAPVAPIIPQFTPADQSTGVEPDAVITAEFSQPMDPATIDDTSFTVSNGGAAVAGAISYDYATRTATFTPAARLELLGAYAVTITTGVADEDGVHMPYDLHFGFTVRDGEWSPATNLDLGEPGSAAYPSVISRGNGRGVAVWAEKLPTSGGLRLNLLSRTYDVATGWSDADVPPVDTYSDVLGLGLAGDANGDVLVVSSELSSLDQQVRLYSDLGVDGIGWTNVDGIATTGQILSAPSAALDPAGVGTAVWIGVDQGVQSVFAARYDRGTGWSTPAPIEHAAGIALTPAVVSDASGTSAFWIQNDGTRQALWWSHFASVSWSAPVEIDTTISTDDFSFVAAADGNGDVFVAGAATDGSNNTAYVVRYAGGSWEAPHVLSTTLTSAPSLAVAPDGTAAAAWREPTGLATVLYTPGTGWATDAIAVDGATANAGSPAVALDDHDGVLVSWFEGGGARTWNANHDVGGTWQGVSSLPTGTSTGLSLRLTWLGADTALVSRIVFDSSGDTHVAVETFH